MTIVCTLLLAGALNEIRQQVGESLVPKSVQYAFWFRALPLMLCSAVLLNCRRTYIPFWRLILIVSPFALLVLARLSWALVRGATGEAVIMSRNALPEAAYRPNRVVWIIFDELDYRATFLERPKSLQLPNFDAFAKTSFRFTNARSPGRQTMFSIPSLIDGIAYTAAFPNGPSKLMLRDAAGFLSPWGTRSNVFTDVRSLGGQSALIGWYLPYGRVFEGVVDHIHWSAFSPERLIGLGLSLPRTLLVHIRGIVPLWRKTLHAETLEELEADTLQTIADPAFSLCFIHLPAPHLPTLGGNGSLTNVAGYFSDVRAYFGNLQIADAIMGRCLAVLDAAPAGARTTLIVSSDHPWRTSQLYDGKNDPRVPFLVRFPGQREGSDVGARVETVATRKLIWEILSSVSLFKRESVSSLAKSGVPFE